MPNKSPPPLRDSGSSHVSGYLDTLTEFIDAHVRYFRMIPSVVGLVGVALSLWYSKVPLRRLCQASNIPEELIRANRRLTGVVRTTSWNTIGVWHVPIWRWAIFWRTYPPENCSPKELLTVQFSGVAISNPDEGAAWLRERLLGNKVWLTLLDRSSLPANVIKCIVYAKPKKKFVRWQRSCVNEELLASGVGSITEVEGVAENSEYSRFISQLILGECGAKEKGRGMWDGTEYVTRWNKIKNYFKQT